MREKVPNCDPSELANAIDQNKKQRYNHQKIVIKAMCFVDFVRDCKINNYLRLVIVVILDTLNRGFKT